MLKRKSLAAIIAVPLIMLAPAEASAFSLSGANAVTIKRDRGGQVINYAIRMLKMKEAGKSVRFAGPCDSACTLYLALPRNKTCVSQGASFGFHLPYGASPSGNKTAAKYLLRSYPGWVRSWISANGGLGSGIKTMSYAYASQYLPTCSKAPRATRTPRAWPRHISTR